ncbi:MAG: serine/threonine-protein kinase [Planctomycetota bacterium]|nr:serine/threonine-protein kinase [Planctomycetota bacterium]
MTLRLRIEHGQDAGKTYRLATAGIYTLGRGTDNSIRVLDMKVSKNHCEIRVVEAGGGVQAALHDPGSTHGCELNGQPVARAKDLPLKPGDELRLGLTILRILSAGDADEDARPESGRAATAPAANGGSNGGSNGGTRETTTKQTLPPDALVGKRLGGYQIDKKIGAGGMGGVYLAEQVSLHRKVALKVLNDNFAADSAFVDQFVNEARAAGALNHPNVVQVYDVSSDQGYYYFSMEVMPGGSIEDKVREGPVAWADGLNWFIDSANALIFARKREILHRDVKPDNLMIGEDGSAKLCDLGLAKKSEVSDLMDQGIIGTPHFISPEAIRRKPDIDHRTDLYSLGCTFYRIFAGKNPYPAGSVKEILLGHLNKPVPRINALNRDVPREIDEVVAKLMAKDPAERFETPEDLLRDLDRIRVRYKLEAHGIKPASRKPLVIGAAAALIAIGVAIWFGTRPKEVDVIQLTPQEQARLDEAQRTEVRGALNEVVGAAQTRYTEQYTKYIGGRIEDEENWKQPMFRDLSKEAKADADDWDEQVKAWQSEKAEKKPEFAPIYDTASSDLSGHAEKMRAIHTAIEKEIAERTQFEAQIKNGKKEAQEDAERLVAEYGRELKKLFDEGSYAKWIDLEEIVRGPKLGEITGELLARKVGRFPLLDQKTLDGILDKHAPITKKDAPRGINLAEEAARRIDGRRGEILGGLQKRLDGSPTHEDFAAIQDEARQALDTIPANLDGNLAAAPTVVAALKRMYDAIERVRKSAGDIYEAFVAKEYATDRKIYFSLLRKIWNPEEGHLHRFELKAASVQVGAAEAMLKVPTYKQLATNWLPLIAGLEGHLAHLIEASKSDGWTDDSYTYIDDKGKERTSKIRGLEPEGVRWDKDVVPFARSSPRFLLDNLFLAGGAPRLKNLTPEDHAGLALLAELGGRYDVAGKHYQAAASGDEALAAAARSRLSKLDLERQAAERYYAILDWIQGTEVWATPYEEQIRALDEDPEAFPKDSQARALEEALQREKAMQGVRNMRDELNDRADLARTVWGSSLRVAMHIDAAYAGEVITAIGGDEPPKRDQPRDTEPKKDAPKKDDPPGKDEAGKDGDAPADDVPGEEPKKDDGEPDGEAGK